jgi:hypothetical protein
MGHRAAAAEQSQLDGVDGVDTDGQGGPPRGTGAGRREGRPVHHELPGKNLTGERLTRDVRAV